MNLYEQDMAVIHTMYGLMTEHKPYDGASNATIAELAGVSFARTSDIAKIAESLGIIKREMHYPSPKNGMLQGRRWRWTLLMPETEAVTLFTEKAFGGDINRQRRLINPTKLHDHEDRISASKAKGNHGTITHPRSVMAAVIDVASETAEMLDTVDEVRKAKLPAATAGFTNPDARETKPVVISKTDSEVTRAIAGPDRTGPFEVVRSMRKPTDAQALVEAARQYRNRETEMRLAIDELVKAADKHGILIDRDAIEANAKYRIDPELDPIARIVPYIDSLEATIARQGSQIVELRNRTQGYDALRAEKNRLIKTNERLIAERVGTPAMRES